MEQAKLKIARFQNEDVIATSNVSLTSITIRNNWNGKKGDLQIVANGTTYTSANSDAFWTMLTAAGKDEAHIYITDVSGSAVYDVITLEGLLPGDKNDTVDFTSNYHANGIFEWGEYDNSGKWGFIFKSAE